MKGPDISLLGYALLGLIHQKPSSGYDLRKTFAETAMGNYSSSPGAIYPALERLADRGLIAGEVKASGGLRRRRLYRLTRSGETELKKWLLRSIVRDDVMRGAQELMLRFSFMDQALGVDAAVSFLQKFRSALKTYVSDLESYLQDNQSRMPLSGRLALESGIRGYHGLQDWTSYAIRAYRESQANPPSRTTKARQGGPR
jgi:DNA-binding PadR family transcriptional regulator